MKLENIDDEFVALEIADQGQDVELDQRRLDWYEKLRIEFHSDVFYELWDILRRKLMQDYYE